jgi:hypothetical protein
VSSTRRRAPRGVGQKTLRSRACASTQYELVHRGLISSHLEGRHHAGHPARSTSASPSAAAPTMMSPFPISRSATSTLTKPASRLFHRSSPWLGAPQSERQVAGGSGEHVRPGTTRCDSVCVAGDCITVAIWRSMIRCVGFGGGNFGCFPVRSARRKYKRFNSSIAVPRTEKVGPVRTRLQEARNRLRKTRSSASRSSSDLPRTQGPDGR